MNNLSCCLRAIITMLIVAGGLVHAASGGPLPEIKTPKASAAESMQRINPEELARIIQSPQGEKPLLLHVGFHVLYVQAHIPGSEYAGPASKEEGIRQLRQRVQSLSRKKFIVIYCGCCPWEHCPNVHPAYRELRAMGFENVKVLYLANNFGTDWTRKGYPIAKGE